MKNRINYLNSQNAIKITPALRAVIRKAINSALEYESVLTPCEVSVSIVDSDEIQRLNREYRQRDSVTDVLSFPLCDWENDELEFEEDILLLGDIILCAQRIEEQANEFGHTMEREIAYLTIHSTLHLLGYDHIDNEKAEKEMTEKQDEIIKGMNL